MGPQGSRLIAVGEAAVLPDTVGQAVDKLRALGTGSGLLPAQAVAAEATAAGLSPESIEDIVDRLAESCVEDVSDDPSASELAVEAAEAEADPPALDVSGPAASADLVRVYLREIG